MNRLVLAASSVADDVGFVALGDLASVLGQGDANYRVIGGHMVTALVARWGLGADLYRETGDTDLGAPPFVLSNHDVTGHLHRLGYVPIAGNRFARRLDDVPAGLTTKDRVLPAAVIDLLIPSYTSRIRQNRRVGPDLVTTEVPGLAVALQRPPVNLDLEMQRLGGAIVRAQIAYPDEVSALTLKALATTVRSKATDIVDLWRCLEIGLAAQLEPSHFDFDEGRTALAIVRRLFDEPHGAGMTALATEQRLTPTAATNRFTRIRALVDRVAGDP